FGLTVPTGTVTFTFFTESGTCTGPSVASGSVTQDGSTSSAHPSSPQGPLDPGTYSFMAHYSGDATYAPADSPCEPLVVTSGSGESAVTTEIHDANHNPVLSVPAGSTVHDKATIIFSSTPPTGTVSFTFFTASNACTGPSVAAGSVTLDGTSEIAHPSSPEGPLAPGLYSFRA